MTDSIVARSGLLEKRLNKALTVFNPELFILDEFGDIALSGDPDREVEKERIKDEMRPVIAAALAHLDVNYQGIVNDLGYIGAKGMRIAAVKLYRSIYCTDLISTKNIVVDAETEARRIYNGPFPGV